MKSYSLAATLNIVFCFQGDGDYELVKDVEIDDYLRKRIAKVLPYLEISLLWGFVSRC